MQRRLQSRWAPARRSVASAPFDSEAISDRRSQVFIPLDVPNQNRKVGMDTASPTTGLGRVRRGRALVGGGCGRVSRGSGAALRPPLAAPPEALSDPRRIRTQMKRPAPAARQRRYGSSTSLTLGRPLQLGERRNEEESGSLDRHGPSGVNGIRGDARPARADRLVISLDQAAWRTPFCSCRAITKQNAAIISGDGCRNVGC